MHIRLTAAAALACLGLLTGCSEEDATATLQQESAPVTAPAPTAGSATAAVQQESAPATAPAPTAGPAPAAQASAAAVADPHAGLNMPSVPQTVPASNEGTVTSVLQAGSYSYIEVDRRGERLWIASGRADVAPGQVVRWGDAAVMRNFRSKALDRTFDQILFVSRVVGPGPRPAPAGGPKGKVVSVTAGGGYNYIEVATDSGTTWIAAPMQKVETGDVVSWSGGSRMQNFNSKALERTFDEILFVPGVTLVN